MVASTAFVLSGNEMAGLSIYMMLVPCREATISAITVRHVLMARMYTSHVEALARILSRFMASMCAQEFAAIQAW